jgi:hypothetical protein
MPEGGQVQRGGPAAAAVAAEDDDLLGVVAVVRVIPKSGREYTRVASPWPSWVRAASAWTAEWSLGWEGGALGSPWGCAPGGWSHCPRVGWTARSGRGVAASVPVDESPPLSPMRQSPRWSLRLVGSRGDEGPDAGILQTEKDILEPGPFSPRKMTTGTTRSVANSSARHQRQ